MRRLPGAVCNLMRPGQAFGSCIRSEVSSDACDTMCVAASVGHVSASAPLAMAGCRAPAASPLLQAGQPSLASGNAAQLTTTAMPLGMSLRGMRMAPAAALQSDGMLGAASALPLMTARQLATAAGQAARQQQQHEGTSFCTSLCYLQFRGFAAIFDGDAQPPLKVNTATASSNIVPAAGISEVTAVKVVKYVVIGMIIVLTVRVMPYMGAYVLCR